MRERDSVSGELDIDWTAGKYQCEPFDVPDRASPSACQSILGSGMGEAQYNTIFVQQEMVRPTFAPILHAAFSSSEEAKKRCDWTSHLISPAAQSTECCWKQDSPMRIGAPQHRA